MYCPEKNLVGEIFKLVDVSYTDFFSGMVEETDTWAAIGSCSKKVNPALRLHCVLPCEGQADGWSTSARELHFSILEQADNVVYMNWEYSKDCMLKRNRYLVDHADCLLAIYNGERRVGRP